MCLTVCRWCIFLLIIFFFIWKQSKSAMLIYCIGWRRINHTVTGNKVCDNHTIYLPTLDFKVTCILLVNMRKVNIKLLENDNVITSTNTVASLEYTVYVLYGILKRLEWLGDCCLTPIQQFLQLYHDENKLIFNEMMMKSALY